MTYQNSRFGRPRDRKTKLTIPASAVPHVKFLFSEMQRLGITYEELAWRANIEKNTLKAWRHKNSPNLGNIEAAINSLGYALVPIPAESTIPADVVAELRPMADRLGLTMPRTLEILIEIMARGSRFSGVTRSAALPMQEMRRAA